MDHKKLIAALERFGAVLPAVVHDLPDEDARWRPADAAWSILEVVGHLADEEVEDFRTRLRLTLHEPASEWPPIDPPRWARERRYNDAQLSEVTQRFVRERIASIKWLRELRDPNWSSVATHPTAGPIHAGDLLAAWAAHDALHLRQIAKRMFQLAQRDGGKYSTRYAGEWTS